MGMPISDINRLPWAELRRRYSGYWVVLVADPGAVHVLAVGRSRAEAKARARPQLSAFDEWGCHFIEPIAAGSAAWFASRP